MRQLETIKLENYYHIYNRGINGEDLFGGKANFIEVHKKKVDKSNI